MIWWILARVSDEVGAMLVAGSSVFIVGWPLRVGCAIVLVGSGVCAVSRIVAEASAVIADDCSGVGRVARMVVVGSVGRWTLIGA